MFPQGVDSSANIWDSMCPFAPSRSLFVFILDMQSFEAHFLPASLIEFCLKPLQSWLKPVQAGRFPEKVTCPSSSHQLSTVRNQNSILFYSIILTEVLTTSDLPLYSFSLTPAAGWESRHRLQKNADKQKSVGFFPLLLMPIAPVINKCGRLK